MYIGLLSDDKILGSVSHRLGRSALSYRTGTSQLQIHGKDCLFEYQTFVSKIAPVRP